MKWKPYLSYGHKEHGECRQDKWLYFSMRIPGYGDLLLIDWEWWTIPHQRFASKPIKGQSDEFKIITWHYPKSNFRFKAKLIFLELTCKEEDGVPIARMRYCGILPYSSCRKIYHELKRRYSQCRGNFDMTGDTSTSFIIQLMWYSKSKKYLPLLLQRLSMPFNWLKYEYQIRHPRYAPELLLLMEHMEGLKEMFFAIRLAKNEIQSGSKQFPYIIQPSDGYDDFLHREDLHLSQMFNASGIQFDSTYQPTSADIPIITKAGTILMIGAKAESSTDKERLQKQLEEIEAQLKSTNTKLENPNFMKKAAPIAIEREQSRKITLNEQKAQILKALGI